MNGRTFGRWQFNQFSSNFVIVFNDKVASSMRNHFAIFILLRHTCTYVWLPISLGLRGSWMVWMSPAHRILISTKSFWCTFSGTLVPFTSTFELPPGPSNPRFCFECRGFLQIPRLWFESCWLLQNLRLWSGRNRNFCPMLLPHGIGRNCDFFEKLQASRNSSISER